MFGRWKDDDGHSSRCIDCGRDHDQISSRSRCTGCFERHTERENASMADRPIERGPLDRIDRLVKELTWATYGVHPDDVFPPIPRGEMAAEQVMRGLEDLASEDPFGAMMGKYDDPRYIDIEEEP